MCRCQAVHSKRLSLPFCVYGRCRVYVCARARVCTCANSPSLFMPFYRLIASVGHLCAPLDSREIHRRRSNGTQQQQQQQQPHTKANRQQLSKHTRAHGTKRLWLRGHNIHSNFNNYAAIIKLCIWLASFVYLAVLYSGRRCRRTSTLYVRWDQRYLCAFAIA